MSSKGGVSWAVLKRDGSDSSLPPATVTLWLLPQLLVSQFPAYRRGAGLNWREGT